MTAGSCQLLGEGSAERFPLPPQLSPLFFFPFSCSRAKGPNALLIAEISSMFPSNRRVVMGKKAARKSVDPSSNPADFLANFFCEIFLRDFFSAIFFLREFVSRRSQSFFTDEETIKKPSRSRRRRELQLSPTRSFARSCQAVTAVTRPKMGISRFDDETRFWIVSCHFRI